MGIFFMTPKYVDICFSLFFNKNQKDIHLLICCDPSASNLGTALFFLWFHSVFRGGFGPFKSGRCQWRRRPFTPIFAFDTHQLVAVWKSLSSDRWKWSIWIYFNLMLLPTVNGQFGSPVKQMWNGQNTVHFMGSFTISTGWTDDLIHQPLLKALELVKQSHVSNPDVWPLIFTSPSFFVGPESDAPFMADLFFSNIQKLPQVQLKQRIINPSPDDGSRVACSCPEQIDVPNPEPFSGSAVNRGKYASLCFKH